MLVAGGELVNDHYGSPTVKKIVRSPIDVGADNSTSRGRLTPASRRIVIVSLIASNSTPSGSGLPPGRESLEF